MIIAVFTVEGIKEIKGLYRCRGFRIEANPLSPFVFIRTRTFFVSTQLFGRRVECLLFLQFISRQIMTLSNYKNKHRLSPLSKSTLGILTAAMQLALISNPVSAKEGTQALDNNSPYQQVAENGAQTQAKKVVKKSASVNRTDNVQSQPDVTTLETMTVYGEYDAKDP
jgi:hypothetical protein